MRQYSDEVKRFFFDRQYAGDLVGPNVYSAEAGALVNGDVVRFMLKVDAGHVQDVRYQVFGSVLTVAACAFFAKRLVGVSVEDIADAADWQSCLRAFDLRPELQSPLVLVSHAIHQAVESCLAK